MKNFPLSDAAFLESYRLSPASKPDFFTRDATPVTLYMLISVGSYGLYWMYRNWDAVRVASGQPMLPLARALAFPLYLWPLLKIIVLLSRQRGYASRFSGGQLTLITLVPLAVRGVIHQPHVPHYAIAAVYVLSGVCCALVLLLAQEAILYNNPAKRIRRYNDVSWVEAIFTVLACLGMLTR